MINTINIRAAEMNGAPSVDVKTRTKMNGHIYEKLYCKGFLE